MRYFRASIMRSFAAFCLLMPFHAYSMSGLDVMEKVDNVTRLSFDTAVVKTKLSTCKYTIIKGRMRCKDTPRVTVLEVGEKKYGPGNRDFKSIAVILEPIKDKGIGMLSYEYYDSDRENDVWLYLSALGKVKRLVSSSDSSEDGGSFFGTEYFVDDVALKKINEYTYKIVREEEHDGRPAWVLEVIPTEARAKRTAYERMLYWVDKERHIILREDIYNRSGKLYKQRLNKNWELIENVWMPKQQTMNNLLSNRITAIQNISVTYDKEVPDEFLTQRSLTDFTFREKNLTRLRSYYK